MEMEEKVLTLRKKWSEFQKTEIDHTEKELTFKYGPLGHEKMIQAILFWKFIRNHLTTEELRKSDLAVTIQEFWKLRRLFLSGFVANRNTFMTIIAMIESFSTSLWRKILWKENLDFVSFESFLRRLEEKHVRAIVESYISIEKDMAFDKPFDEEKRYLSKSAWSYNLLGLDFGFNAYPKGEADDTKVMETSPFVFLSEKNHADDFVVNTEEGYGGKYWWLYKKARSNYVWHTNRDVQLKTHICPGFWYTLFVHFLFWFASPLLSAFFIAMISSGNFHKALLAIIPVAAITPLWLLVAGMKALVNSVFLERTWDRFANVADWVLLTGVCVGGASVFVWLAISFYRFLIENHIDILMTLVFLSIPAAFIAYCVHCRIKYDNGERVSGMLEFCFKMYVTAACIFVIYRAIKLYHEFFWKIIVLAAYFIAAVSMKIWEFLANPLFLGVVVLPLVILGLFFYISRIVFLHNPTYVEYSKLNFSQKRLPIKYLRKIFSPFSILWDVLSKIAEYSKTLDRLYELFNKRCPYVAKSKPLTRD